ncbi:MAG: putative DNA binding domain-containing protein [Thermoplasmata archaeon]|nr:putative DNA binding domain-containing protein [Thermoplasmata archaeon]
MSDLRLPINISDLLKGHSVEWERLEMKKGWNPENILHSICAFANDFHNLGGGYIIIGLEEKNGISVLPPKGIDPKIIDRIQKELFNLCNHAIRPSYHPLSSPVRIDGRWILVLWVPGGEVRPYRAKTTLSKNSNEWAFYIRKMSSTVRAKGEDELDLINLAAKIPFDDRYNQTASTNDLSKRLIEEFLQDVRSDLAREVESLSSEELGRQMNVVGGPSESPFPKNIGLLFFNDEPHEFFPYTQIDVVWFPEGPGGNRFDEKIFKGPIHRITKESLDFIRRNYLKETVVKRPDRAEADRFWNFPYAAIEEAVVNAVYHRSYEIREPIEIRITVNDLTVISFPGPDRSIKMDDLRSGKAVSRRYRNRRIGEFLKELDLAEGRSTGIPKILRAMDRNGSPVPEFETDEDRTYFLMKMPIHTGSVQVTDKFEGAQSRAQSGAQSNDIMNSLREDTLSVSELVKALGLKSRTGSIKRTLKDLLSRELIEYTIPEKPNSRSQRYRLTRKGRSFLENKDQ